MRAAPDGRPFAVSTRQGRQFNSMVQREIDPLTGAGRDDILISRDDLTSLRFAEGSRVRLRSAAGSFSGRLRAASIRPGNLEALARGQHAPLSRRNRSGFDGA